MTMKHTLFFLIILTLWSIVGYSQKYDVESIDKSLFKNANLILRKNEERLMIYHPQKIKYTVSRVVTVLNEQGNNDVAISIPYNTVNKIDKINIVVYNENSEIIRKVSRKEMYDHAYSDEHTLAQDVRYLSFYYTPIKYPYTIEFKYELELKQSLFIPAFLVKPYPNCSIEQQSFTVAAEQHISVSTLLVNTRRNFNTVSAGNFRETRYVDSLIYSEEEDNARLLVKINEFDLYGYSGFLTDWESLGRFYFELNENQMKMPEHYSQKIRSKVASIKDTIEKIKAVYKLLQDDFRYISIQLGVGGWKCADAESTIKNGFGDCKALSNMMCAMLKEIGVESYVSLLYADKFNDPVIPSFPKSYFNHVVVCVPFAKDTLWLECTDNTSVFNYLAIGTADKYTLLVKKNKSELIKTPAFNHDTISSKYKYGIANNIFFYHGDVMFTGNIANDFFPAIMNDNNKEKNDILLNIYNIAIPNLLKFDLQIVKNKIPKVRLSFISTPTRLHTISGKRIYFKLNNVDYLRYFTDEVNHSDYLQEVVLLDEYLVVIPQGYQLDSKLSNSFVDFKFGSIKIEYEIEEDKIKIKRTISQKKRVVSKNEKDEFVKYKTAFSFGNKEEIVFVVK